MELLHSVIDNVHLSLRLGGVALDKQVQPRMQLMDEGVITDEIGLVLGKIKDQLNVWLARSLGFNDRLQEIVKGNLYYPFSLSFVLHPRTPVDIG